MILRRYYVFPSTTPMPKGVEYEAKTIGPTQSLAHIQWDGFPALQKTFEAQPGVESLGTLAHPAPSLSEAALAASPTASAALREIGTALQAAGVLSSDPVIVLVEKMQAKYGGFQVHY
jgi:hypothetical protein